jgi:hypothetical protein
MKRVMGATAVATAVLGVACRAIVGIQDLSVVDAGGARDAAADVATEAAPAMPVTFTDDFDDAAAVGNGWDNVIGSVSLDDTLYVSPPNSAKMVLQAVDSGAFVKSYLNKGFGLVASEAVLSFDVHIETGCTQTTSSVTLARIYFTTDYAIDVYLTPNNPPAVVPLHVQEYIGSTQNDPHPIASVSAGMGNEASFWHHVILSVRIQPVAEASVTVAVDSDLDAATSYPLPLAATALEGGALPPNVWLGMISLAPRGPCRMNYDNATITLTP